MWESRSFEINGVKYKYEAKVYDVGSKYGINNGRISKLKVVNDIGPNSWTWDNTVINYDRGWDIRPETKLDKMALQYILDLYK